MVRKAFEMDFDLGQQPESDLDSDLGQATPERPLTFPRTGVFIPLVF